MSDTISRDSFPSKRLGVIACVVESLVLAGCYCDIPVLKSVLPVVVAMTANTALGFILAGLALWGYVAHAPPARGWPRAGALPGFRRVCQPDMGMTTQC
jgi:hypothetical protein